MNQHTGTRYRILGLSAAVTAVVAVVTVASPWSSADASPVERMMSVEPSMAKAKVDELASKAKGGQRAALSDKVVTFGEYRAAVQATVRCFEQGVASELPGVVIEIHGPTASPDRFAVTFSTTVDTTALALTSPEPSDANAISAIEDACYEEHQNDVAQAYQISLLADDDFVQKVAKGFDDCAKEAGIESLGATEREVFDTLISEGSDTRLQPCFTEAPSVNDGFSIAAKARSDER